MLATERFHRYLQAAFPHRDLHVVPLEPPAPALNLVGAEEDRCAKCAAQCITSTATHLRSFLGEERLLCADCAGQYARKCSDFPTTTYFCLPLEAVHSLDRATTSSTVTGK